MTKLALTEPGVVGGNTVQIVVGFGAGGVPCPDEVEVGDVCFGRSFTTQQALLTTPAIVEDEEA